MSKKHFRALADAIASIADKAERERVCESSGAVCAGAMAVSAGIRGARLVE